MTPRWTIVHDQTGTFLMWSDTLGTTDFRAEYLPLYMRDIAPAFDALVAAVRDAEVWPIRWQEQFDRAERAEIDAALVLGVLGEYVAGNRIVDGYWYSPDETGEAHNINDPATADELALVESLRTEVGL